MKTRKWKTYKYRKTTPGRLIQVERNLRTIGTSAFRIAKTLKKMRDKPFYSKVTGKRYKTEKSMLRAEKEALTPNSEKFFSEITGKYYMTEKGMLSAEKRAAKKEFDYMSVYGQVMAGTIEEIDNEYAGTSYSSLGHLRNRWSHNENSIMHRIFYSIQDGNWVEYEGGSIVEYYNTYGLDNPDIEGHTLRHFIKFILGAWDI